MRIRLLGTGSADGWPNAFCTCDSCKTERDRGRTRRPTCALIDDIVMIDSGPTAPYAASDAGISLRDVEHLVLTHGHPDHLAPSILLWREWITGLGTLHVWGPAMAIDMCRDWVGPQSPVTFHVLEDGESANLNTARGTYLLRALPANHDPRATDVIAGEALLYDLEDPHGDRLLYATDTGPFTAELLECMNSRAYACVLVDESFGDKLDHGTGHFDLATLPASLAAAGTCGAIIDTTRTIAVHLSHHNPPTAVLRERLRTMGVELMDDLAVIDTGRLPSPTRHLVTGGARSGKSSFAERCASEHAQVTYIATGGQRPDDLEWQQRITAHQVRRPAHWQTIETADLPAALAQVPAGSLVLIDCLALWLTAQLDAAEAWGRESDQAMLAQVHASIDALVAALEGHSTDVIMVTNEVGMGLVPAHSGGRLFRDLLGILNSRIAGICTRVTLVVAGRPLELTGDRHD